MSESIQSTLISALPAATKVSDTDIVVLENGSTTQKITIAQLKEALGINALNTKYTNEVLTCSAGVVREYTFPNLPEHKISFPVLIGASSNIAGCVVARVQFNKMSKYCLLCSIKLSGICNFILNIYS